MKSWPTFGVEEEFLLVDPSNGHPAPNNDEVARLAKRDGVELQLELTKCQVETTSPVTATTTELRKHLRDLRRTAASAAAEAGVTLLAVAVPPVIPDEFPLTDTPRYRRIGDRFGMVAHEQGICGAHVHVAVPDRETAVVVSNHLRPWLPILLASTANSAIYRGAESGYASWRSVLWQRWPCAGPPPYFESATHYDSIVEMMLASGAILDDGMVYWDVRPSANFPTVEIRVSDVPATVDDTVLFATLVRGLVITVLDAVEHEVPAPRIAAQTLRAAYWKAAHDGISGNAIDVVNGTVVAAFTLMAKLLATVRPVLEELGEYDDAERGIATLVANGNGAVHQLDAFRRRGDVDDVVAECARLTLA